MQLTLNLFVLSCSTKVRVGLGGKCTLSVRSRQVRFKSTQAQSCPIKSCTNQGFNSRERNSRSHSSPIQSLVWCSEINSSRVEFSPVHYAHCPILCNSSTINQVCSCHQFCSVLSGQILNSEKLNKTSVMLCSSKSRNVSFRLWRLSRILSTPLLLKLSMSKDRLDSHRRRGFHLQVPNHVNDKAKLLNKIRRT